MSNYVAESIINNWLQDVWPGRPKFISSVAAPENGPLSDEVHGVSGRATCLCVARVEAWTAMYTHRERV